MSEGVDVSHDVVPELPLLLGGHGEVDVLGVALHLLDLSVRDRQTQFLRGNDEAEMSRRQAPVFGLWSFVLIRCLRLRVFFKKLKKNRVG